LTELVDRPMCGGPCGADTEGELMSYNDWTREYHLTPRGWINGTSTHRDSVRGAEVARPDDAVETWEEHGDQHSGWSREMRASRLIWFDAQRSEDARDAMRGRLLSPF
jgi:hypothetical protein